MKNRGYFIQLDGPQCSGKSSIVKQLKKDFSNKGYNIFSLDDDKNLRKLIKDYEISINANIGSDIRNLAYLFAISEEIKKGILYILKDKKNIFIQDRRA